MFKCRPPEKMEGSRPKARPNISVQAEGFMRRERENIRGRAEGFEKFSTCRPAPSILRRISKLVKRWSGVCPPGTAAEGQQISFSWVPDGGSLLLLKLGLRIPLQRCCSSTSYKLGRVSIYRNRVKRMMGWVT